MSTALVLRKVHRRFITPQYSGASLRRPAKIKKGSIEMTKLGKHIVMSTLVPKLAVIALIVFAGSGAAYAQNGSAFFSPENLVVSRSVYDNNPNIIAHDRN